MKDRAYNPYLPLDEYVPDAEPRVFDGRLYVYGSHDRAGGDFFCIEDYVVYSAPEADLSDWRYEGVSYRRDQDPTNADGSRELFAPDVVKGADGCYYLFYCVRFVLEFGVARSKSPAGPFEYYGHVHYPDGRVLSEYMPYDPSVLVDYDGRIYLYYGFSNPMLAARFDTEVSPGCCVVELEDDMLTVKSAPRCLIPWHDFAGGTTFEGHAYFEAPSMRHIGSYYYLVYSSEWSRELCYAISTKPDSGFRYGGVIIDNGNIGIDGRVDPEYQPGNNHGGLIEINGDVYMFYHRHTNGNSFNRQGCLEKVRIAADGSIAQVVTTTSGPNGAALPAEGSYPASICCALYGRNPAQLHDFRNLDTDKIPYITASKDPDAVQYEPQIIANVADGTVIGYRYFKGDGNRELVLLLRGDFDGSLMIGADAHDTEAEMPIAVHSERFAEVLIPWRIIGEQALFLRFAGTGAMELVQMHFT